MLSGTPTRRPFSWRGWAKRDWIKLLFGTISKPLMAQRGVDEWISSLPVSPASRSRRPAASEGLTMNVGSGPTLPGSSATWNPDTCSWKTSQGLFVLDYPKFSTILPGSGSMRNGVCSPQPPLALLTSVNGSGSWHTPTTTHGVGGGFNSRGEPTLPSQAKMWPTPQAGDYVGDSTADRARNSPPLPSVAAMWPTPRASMNENRTGKHAPSHGVTHGKTLAGEASHRAPTTEPDGTDGSPKVDLNPFFVATLMGLPMDWLTHSISEVMASCRNAPRTPGGNSLNVEVGR